MSSPSSEKLQKLTGMLDRMPNDTFLLYAIAMEYRKLGAAPQALEFLQRTIAVDPDYAYAYFQRGQVFEDTGDTESAKAAYRDGIAAADRKGDAHARNELAQALQLIE